jgi:chitin deacetylase
MDAGARVSWEQRIRDGEVSAIQTAENLLLESGDQFWAEYQNEPRENKNGIWRLHPEQVAAMKSAGWEIASHGLKWVDHRDMDEATERAQIAESFRLHTEVTGEPPRGWYTGRCSMNTVRLTAETARLDWISDTYDDDLPYWMEAGDRDQLVIPYTLEANDMRFATAPGYIEGEQFFTYLRDTFDTLYAEGLDGRAKMFSIGLHCRLIGRPGKIAGLIRFLDYAQRFEGVWFARRIDIAQHWIQNHPYAKQPVLSTTA